MAVSSSEEDEYIDMEIASFSNFFSNPRNSREFEFQMSSLSMERQPTTFPADQLFYKGKLLPLFEIPGFESVRGGKNGIFEEFYGTPLATTTVTTPTTTNTPFESCNISPRESCSVSRELNPVDYSLLFEYSTEMDVSRSVGEIENPKKSWTKKLKLTSRLKASRSYLKAFFGKSGCSNESSAVAKDGNKASIPIPKPKQSQLGLIDQDKGRKLADNRHRRSFSMAIKRFSSTNKSSTSSSSSSSSTNSNGFQYLQFLRRSSSVNAEIESPMQGAIAHCKRSQMRSERSLGDGL